ncbi:AER114Wp [Eremothecium gossypii ATCC 10895]|uniref:Coronin n=1 Tax=Eremothecium gossypii (strain ATCC 10895 / CBS 109.51 / FGSC 9923 / NRRL Y-1056) TaxID=284811 RepID=Q756Z9_EREGS|nr:AER114Wp [Eremothecium gossypii ATCC 10895]AAS52798.1 AER114Wp [Eremothecium gossypii ATCC 10895]
MSGKFVRASKYRHVFGQSTKKELFYENLKVTINAWDSNLIKTNGKFISVTWNSSGGGAFAVVPVEEVGKAPDQIPLFRGHTAQVLDTDFDPFDERMLVSGSDDGRIGVWEIPATYSFHNAQDEDGNVEHVAPVKFLTGHQRKVGHVLYHPTAQGVLASSSLDHTVRLWNVEQGTNPIVLTHPDMVTSMSFSYGGTYLATVCRDKMLRVWDIRKGEVVSEGMGHSGPKNQRVVWLGNSDRLATTGFSKLSDRQIAVWDAFNLEKGQLGGFYNVDQSSGILMPFYDDSNKILYVAGKGDGNIRYYEFQDDELYELSEFQSTEPQRGFAVAPKRSVNVKENEVLRAYKTVRDQCIEPISFFVPRKAEVFQDDIYPDAPSGKPALTAEEWFAGKSVDGPILFSVQSLYDGSDPVFCPTDNSPARGTEASSPKRPAQKNSSPARSSPVRREQAAASDAATTKTAPTKASAVKAASPRPSTDADKLLQTDDTVNQMLQKACSFDEVNRAENPARDTSGWDSDDEKSASPKLSPMRKASNSRTRLSPQAVAHETPHRDLSPMARESPRPRLQVDGHPTTPLSAKSMDLRQSVEKLSALVQQLDTVATKLAAAADEKDQRIKKLEERIQQLIDSQSSQRSR